MTIYDYSVIGFYFVFMLALGFATKRLSKSSNDFFAGGFRMTWWMVGSSTFVANFTAWTFTGAAQVAYKYGIVILAVFMTNAISYFIQSIWLARWFRQMRIVTAMDAVRDRYGRPVEQFYNVMIIIKSLAGVAVPLLGTSIILSTALDLPQVPLIIVTGVVVTFLSIMGGRWAVVASDFIQSLLIASICVVVAALTIIKLGGFSEFWGGVPDMNKEFFLGSDVNYDGFWVLAVVLTGLCMNNSLDDAIRYISAKDSENASRAAAFAGCGFLIFPFMFFIPPLAAHVLEPDLFNKFSGFSNPAEASYIAVCMNVLPQGMLGLLVAGIFAATMSTVDTGLNQLSGFFVKNFYQPILKPLAKDGELLKVGIIVSALLGAFGISLAVYLAAKEDVPLFEVYQMMNSYVNIPLGVPLFLGLFVKNSPKWVPYPTIAMGMFVSVFFYNLLPMEGVAETFSSLVSPEIVQYAIGHKFAVTNIANMVIMFGFFFAMTKLFPNKDKGYQKNVNEFFVRMKTPVDFDKEVGGDNSIQQAQMMGWFAVAYGASMLLGCFIPNPMTGRLGFLFCASVMGGVGILLLRQKKVDQPQSACNK